MSITVESWGHGGDRQESCGGMGGWVDGHDWPAYLDSVRPEDRERYEAIRTAVIRDKIRYGGDWHQQEGEPLFSDGTYGSFSFRAWGDLLAAIWNSEEKTDQYGYMNFYMCGWAGADSQ